MKFKDREPFRKETLNAPLDTFTVRLNAEEREMLNEAKKILNQPKDSTALKQLSSIGAKVLHSDLTGSIIKDIFANKRRNYRTGINEFD